MPSKSLIRTALIIAMLASPAAAQDVTGETLDAAEVRALLVGNTLTAEYSWGKWAEYQAPDGSGYSAAWGEEWREEAASTYEIREDGETCWWYTGEPEWADPEQPYCTVILRTEGGRYHFRNTTHMDPEMVGETRAMAIREGNPLDLGE